MDQITRDFFVYLVNFGNIAAAATVNVIKNIQADSDFEWIESAVYGNLHGTAEPISDASLLPINIQITDSGSGRILMDAPVPIGLIAGNGKLPFILPESRIFMAKSTIQLTATSFGAGTFDNVVLAMIGRKIFRLG